MGFFDDVGGFFNNVGEGLGGFFGGIKETASDVFNEVKSFGKTLFDTGVSIIKAPTQLLDKAIDKGADVVKAVSSDVKDTVTNASKEVGGAIGSISNSLTLPIAAVGIAAAFLLLKKQ
jgi:hypothetical protein